MNTIECPVTRRQESSMCQQQCMWRLPSGSCGGIVDAIQWKKQRETMLEVSDSKETEAQRRITRCLKLYELLRWTKAWVAKNHWVIDESLIPNAVKVKMTKTLSEYPFDFPHLRWELKYLVLVPQILPQFAKETRVIKKYVGGEKAGAKTPPHLLRAARELGIVRWMPAMYRTNRLMNESIVANLKGNKDDT